MRTFLKKQSLVMLAAAAIAAAAPALAEKPAWAGGGKPGHEDQARRAGDHRDARRTGERRDEARRDRDRRDDVRRERMAPRTHFDDRHRGFVHDYYRERFSSGHCPPGLAKKHNGCMPPGQAKKWRVGRPLPRDVIFYDLPRALVVELGPPPPGHRYVRVAADILLIAVGTAIVVDAIEDLGRH